MKILIHMFLLPTLLLSQQAANIPSLADKPVHFRVFDQNGEPVHNAYVEASRYGPGNATGHTNPQGRLTLQLTKGASLHVYVSKDGYYNTGGELWRGGMVKDPDRKLVAKEVPDNFTVTLKQVINPIELRHFSFRGLAPKSSQPIGFDLEAGDWIKPFGRGSVSDIIFHFFDIQVDETGYEGKMSVMFSNAKDGIQSFKAARPFSREFGSDLAPPNEAPVSGYNPSLMRSIAHKQGAPYSSHRPDQTNYLIRTRSRTDAAGVIRQACYGWIEGEIEFDPRDPRGPQLAFTYYFNPDPDPDARSLEYSRHVPKQR